MQLLLARALTLLGLALLVGGCAPSSPPATTAPPAASSSSATAAPPPAAPTSAPGRTLASQLSAPVPIRVGVLSILGEAGIYIALERGYFAEEGLAVDVVTFDTGAAAIPALASGQVEVGGGALSPGFINAIQRGVNVKMVSSLSSNQPGQSGSMYMLPKELVDQGLVRDWADPRGRVVAVPPGRPNVGDYLLARSLERGGLTLADVEVAEMPLPDYLPAFANGKLDLAHVPEPMATVAADRGVAVKWRGTGDYMPGVTPAVLTYGSSLLDGSTDVGQRFMVGYLRGARDYNDAFRRGIGKAEVVATLVKSTSVKDPALYDRIGLAAIDPDGALNMASLADQAAFYHEFGSIPSPVDVSAFVDVRFRDAAVARLGPYQGR